jgi:hypothetical protein
VPLLACENSSKKIHPLELEDGITRLSKFESDHPLKYLSVESYEIVMPDWKNKSPESSAWHINGRINNFARFSEFKHIKILFSFYPSDNMLIKEFRYFIIDSVCKPGSFIDFSYSVNSKFVFDAAVKVEGAEGIN